MDTILDYIIWKRDVPFTVKDVTDVDSVVFSFLSYMDLRDILVSGRKMTVAECCRELLAKQENMTDAHRRLYEALADSERFGPVVIGSYMDSLVEEESVQFSVMLFCVRKDLTYIAFRGTDNTLAGWKEDFMTCFTLTGGQRMALRYLRRHIRPGMKYDIGGHSKGGNLAMYALSQIEYDRLKQVRHVYLHDAPGLCPDVMDVSGLARIRSRTTRFLPTFSVIGRLFAPDFPNTVLVQSTADGIMQHDIETWRVDHGKLLTASAPDAAADLINESVEGWLTGLSTEERRHFVDDVFQAAGAGGAKTVEELKNEGVESTISAFAASADRDSRDAAAKLTLSALFGRYTDKIWNLRLFRGLRNSELAWDILLILCGYLLRMLPIHSMGVIVGLVLLSLVAFQLIVTIRHLIDSGWDLKSEHVRVNACIMLMGAAYVVLVKEQALFNISTSLFGILFLVMSYNHAILLRKEIGWSVPRVRYLLMTVMYAFVGFFVLVSAEHEISWYAGMAGNLLILDGLSGIIHEVQAKRARGEEDKKTDR